MPCNFFVTTSVSTFACLSLSARSNRPEAAVQLLQLALDTQGDNPAANDQWPFLFNNLAIAFHRFAAFLASLGTSLCYWLSASLGQPQNAAAALDEARSLEAHIPSSGWSVRFNLANHFVRVARYLVSLRLMYSLLLPSPFLQRRA